MKTDKIIIIGNVVENNMFFDKESFREFLQHMIDIKKWEREMIEDIKRVVKIYETPGDISLPIK